MWYTVSIKAAGFMPNSSQPIHRVANVMVEAASLGDAVGHPLVAKRRNELVDGMTKAVVKRQATLVGRPAGDGQVVDVAGG